MSFLSTDTQIEVKQLFEGLTGEVRLLFFTLRESPLIIPGHGCETCKDTRLLLEEVVSLTDKIKIEVHDFEAESDLLVAGHRSHPGIRDCRRRRQRQGSLLECRRATSFPYFWRAPGCVQREKRVVGGLARNRSVGR